MREKEIDPKFSLIEYENTYSNRAQVAGYFDGDGPVYLNTGSNCALQFAVVWSTIAESNWDNSGVF